MENYLNRYIKIASCTLNQWAMDFSGNRDRIIESIKQAKSDFCAIRIGPELEIPGYGCEDHFLELDTIYHSWEVLSEILPYTDDILCDIGMAIEYQGIIYNCRVLVFNKEILMIRPKIALADDGNYRESRWFTAWSKGYILESFNLPICITKVNNQIKTKFGLGVIAGLDFSYACEICEELWAPLSPSTILSSIGVDIIANSSGSHFQVNKQERRFELIVNSSKKNGGVFVYSNSIGCDGGRLYFDGGSFICINGQIVSEGKRFSLNEVEIVTSLIDLNQVSMYRNSIKSRCLQASTQNKIPVVELDIRLCERYKNSNNNIFNSITPRQYSFEEELTLGPSCWLWDYLRRSGAAGFFLPLSGGVDSSCVAVMVALMTTMVYKEIAKGNKYVLEELRKITKDSNFTPKSNLDICNRIFVTCFMPTVNSSSQTKFNSEELAKEINSFHLDIDINDIVKSFYDTFTRAFKQNPKFLSEGGTINEDLALQNIQARTRMVLSYFIASLVPWTRKSNGVLLVLGSANLDEGLIGYLTKYDCSSADINPIGSISKKRLRGFMTYVNKALGYKTIEMIMNTKSTAELRPNQNQVSEEDIGITYEELSLMGQLRKNFKLGPLSMFVKLKSIWTNLKDEEIKEKVTKFFRKYGTNRHKMTVVTPSLHVEDYSLDDNRYDLRQFLYNSSWNFQFGKIEKYSSVDFKPRF